jgi:Tol biopolymer transport system component
MFAAMAAGQGKRTQDFDVQLKAAAQKELIDGDPKGAIGAYDKIYKAAGADRAAGANRATAVKALVEIGRLREKLGTPDAKKAFEEVIHKFGDQPEAVAYARARLESLRTPAVTYKGRTQLSVRGGYYFLSPDGQYLHSPNVNLLVNLATGEQRSTANNSSSLLAHWSAISSDGKQLAYGLNGAANPVPAELRMIPLHDAGKGIPGTLVFRSEEFVRNMPFAWSADGKEIYTVISRRDGTYAIAAFSSATASYRILKSLEWRWPKRPSLSPNGRYIAYDVSTAKDSTNRDIFVLASDGSSEVRVTDDAGNDSDPLWTPGSDAIVYRSDRDGAPGMWLAQIAEGKLQGKPDKIRSNTFWAPVGLSPDGSFYYSQQNPRAASRAIYAASVDPASGAIQRDETIVTNDVAVAGNSGVGYSPNGRQIAYFSPRDATFNSSSLGLGPFSLIIRSLDSGEERKLKTAVTTAADLVWLPDGNSILFMGRLDSDPWITSLLRMDLASKNLSIIRENVHHGSLSVSPDGRSAYYVNSLWDGINRIELESGREMELYSGSVKLLKLSPDGKQIAFVPAKEDPTARYLYVMPAAGGTPRQIPVASTSAVNFLGWSTDGASVRIGLGQDLWSVPVDGREPSRIAANQTALWGAAIRPDGKQAVFSRASSSPFELWVEPNFLASNRWQVFTVDIDRSTGKVKGSPLPIASGHLGQNTSPMPSPNGKFVALQPGSELVVRSLNPPGERVFATGSWDWFHDGKSLLVGEFARLDVDTGRITELVKVTSELKGWAAALSPDDTTLYVASNGNEIVVFDLTTGRETRRFRLPESAQGVYVMTVSHDGQRLAIWNTNSSLFTIGVHGSGLVKHYDSPRALHGIGVGWSKDDQGLLFAVGGNGTSQIFHLPLAGKSSPTFTGIEVTGLKHFLLSADGSKLIFNGIAATKSKVTTSR